MQGRLRRRPRSGSTRCGASDEHRDTPTSPAPSLARSQRRRAVLASTVGTTIEWYDFFLYGTAAALVFPHIFFPGQTPYAGVIASFGTQFVGFAARPIGAAIFGHYGDRIGRKATLITTLLLMGIGSTLIGVLPGYAAIGIAAPILLTVLRLVQGVARRRRVGRLGAHVDGVGLPEAARAHGELAAARRPDRSVAVHRDGPADVGDHRPGLRDLGLAGAVPGQHRAGRDRALRAVAGAGEPGLRRGEADAGGAEAPGHRGVPSSVAGDPHLRLRPDVRAGAVLPVHHVRPGLRHQAAEAGPHRVAHRHPHRRGRRVDQRAAVRPPLRP